MSNIELPPEVSLSESIRSRAINRYSLTTDFLALALAPIHVGELMLRALSA